MGIKDEYTAFCFDEACALIVTKIKEGEKPVIKHGEKEGRHVYTNPSSVYSKFNNG